MSTSLFTGITVMFTQFTKRLQLGKTDDVEPKTQEERSDFNRVSCYGKVYTYININVRYLIYYNL